MKHSGIEDAGVFDRMDVIVEIKIGEDLESVWENDDRRI